MQLEIDFQSVPERNARNSDPETSKAASRSSAVRAGGQQVVLLRAYYRAGERGLTSEEAGEASGILISKPRSCYWKRVSEMRQNGLLEVTDETRQSSCGEAQRVLRITAAGRRVVDAMDLQG